MPTTIEGAMGKLEGLAALIYAMEWERAAIVAAYVKVEPRAGRQRSNGQSKNRNKLMTPQEFADLGIAGLTNHETVARYVNAWMNVAQRPRPEPGDGGDLDGLPEWPRARYFEYRRPQPRGADGPKPNQ